MHFGSSLAKFEFGEYVWYNRTVGSHWKLTALTILCGRPQAKRDNLPPDFAKGSEQEQVPCNERLGFLCRAHQTVHLLFLATTELDKDEDI